MIEAENTVVCMASLLSLNGHILSHFDTIHSKLPTHVYFAVPFHSMWSKYKNSKNTFYDVINSVPNTARCDVKPKSNGTQLQLQFLGHVLRKRNWDTCL